MKLTSSFPSKRLILSYLLLRTSFFAQPLNYIQPVEQIHRCISVFILVAAERQAMWYAETHGEATRRPVKTWVLSVITKKYQSIKAGLQRSLYGRREGLYPAITC